MSPFSLLARRVAAAFAFTVLLGCVSAPPAAEPTPGSSPRAPASAPVGAISTISFEAGPCFGFCPDFSVTVSASGAIRYEGRRFTQVQGVRSLPANPALFARLSEIVVSPRLPWPRGDVVPGRPTCQTEVTDLPSYRLAVRGTGGMGNRGFAFYAGCGGPDANRARAMVDEVMAALAAAGVPTEGVPPRSEP